MEGKKYHIISHIISYHILCPIIINSCVEFDFEYLQRKVNSVMDMKFDINNFGNKKSF